MFMSWEPHWDGSLTIRVSASHAVGRGFTPRDAKVMKM